jgi:propionyl-CoA carboxylase alpha chain
MICHADTREQAIQKTLRAIAEYEITGLETTLGFCAFVLKHEAFTSGHFDTKFVEKYFTPASLQSSPLEEEKLLAAALASLSTASQKPTTAPLSSVSNQSNWKKNRID